MNSPVSGLIGIKDSLSSLNKALKSQNVYFFRITKAREIMYVLYVYD
jgi:hypothetical protein